MNDYLKVNQMLQQIQLHCQFRNMRKRVKNYIRKCSSCQQNKHVTHMKYENIQYQKSSELTWDEVMMDFIIKLLLSKDSATEISYNSILIIIYHLIKYSYFILFKKIYSVS